MWLLPSKGRPAALARFFAAYEKTGGSTPGIVIIDRADWDENRYDAILPLPLGWSWRVTDGITQGDKLREIWPDVVNCAWLGLIGDDCVPETGGWDRELVGELDGTNFVSCNDGWLAPKRVANCWVMAGPLVRAVGYIFPPGLHHLFVDDVWEYFAAMVAGLWTCRIDVMVRHRHVLKGAAEADATHKAVYGEGFVDGVGPDRTAGLWAGDEATFAAWRDDGEAARAVAEIRRIRGESVDLKVNTERELQQKRMSRVKSRSVLFGWPCHDKFEAGFLVSWTNTVTLLERMKIRYDSQLILGSSNLPKARNRLAAYFLAGDWDDLIFIDSDMEWDAGAIVRLLASERDIIGAVGRRKTEEESWCCLLMPKGTRVNQDDMGALEVRRVGTGLLKISRSAFERIMTARPDLKRHCYDPDIPAADLAKYHRFFAFDDHEGGEDYYFCDLARDVGASVWVDPHVKLGHTGSFTYWGRFADCLGQAFEVADTGRPPETVNEQRSRAGLAPLPDATAA